MRQQVPVQQRGLADAAPDAPSRKERRTAQPESGAQELREGGEGTAKPAAAPGMCPLSPHVNLNLP